MNALDAIKLSKTNLNLIQRKKIKEVFNISNLITLRTDKKANYLVYSVYQDNLSIQDYVSLLKEVKTIFIAKGYTLERVAVNKTDCYTFLISWENIEDILEETKETELI